MKRLTSNISLGLLMASLLALSACHKDFPVDREGDVELWFHAEMPHENLLEGGKDDYEQATGIKMGDIGVEEHSATFRQVGCEDCPGQLRLIFRDHKKKEDISAFDVDSTFALGEWRFRGEEDEINQPATAPNPLSFRFSGTSDGTPPFSYEWEFGDGHISTEPMPIHTYGSSGDFEVKLKIQDAQGCADQSSHKISVGNNYASCPYDFEIERLGNNMVRFTPTHAENLPFSDSAAFFWDFGLGAGSVVFAPFPIMEFQFPAEGIYPVTLIIFDDCGCPCPITKNVFTANAASCVSDIAFKTVPEDQEVSRVTIEWTDENGTFYTSYGSNGQPEASQFQLIEREMYKPNPQGKSTYKLSASFDCVLYNPVNPNDSIIVKNGESIFALEMPE